MMSLTYGFMLVILKKKTRNKNVNNLESVSLVLAVDRNIFFNHQDIVYKFLNLTIA